MALGEVSTRGVPEIDLIRGGHLHAFEGTVVGIRATFLSPEFKVEHEVAASTQPSPFLQFVIPHDVGTPRAEEKNVGLDFFRFAEPVRSTWRLVHLKPTSGRILSSESVAGMLVYDIAHFVSGTSKAVCHTADATAENANAILSAVDLTKRLRFFAEGEPSRPILDLNEGGNVAVNKADHRKAEGRISVSPGLRKTTSSANAGGLGYVSAGLLLWLETSNKDDENS